MKRVLLIATFAAVGILLSSGLLAAYFFRPTLSTAIATVEANKNIDNATYSVLKYCMPTLPGGSSTCDAGIKNINDNCLNNFKVVPDSCKDPRIAKYLDARTAQMTLTIQGKPVPPQLLSK